MSLLVHLSLCPWNRTTARSLVAVSTGGIELLYPWGMSTLTYGRWCLRRKSSVSAWLSPANQLSCRSSTAIRSGLHRLAPSSRYCLLGRRTGNQRGERDRMAPAFPAAPHVSRRGRD